MGELLSIKESLLSNCIMKKDRVSLGKIGFISNSKDDRSKFGSY